MEVVKNELDDPEPIRTFITVECLRLIEECRINYKTTADEALSRAQKNIADYSIAAIKVAKTDEPPENFIELCQSLVEKGLLVAKAKGLKIYKRTMISLDSSKNCLKNGKVSLAADIILDAIDDLRFSGAL
jgi:hypothetical protein